VVIEVWLWVVVVGVGPGEEAWAGVGLLLLLGVLVLGLALDLNVNFCLGVRALRAWESLSERALMCYIPMKGFRRYLSSDENL